jgi:hypothetical protein
MSAAWRRTALRLALGAAALTALVGCGTDEPQVTVVAVDASRTGMRAGFAEVAEDVVTEQLRSLLPRDVLEVHAFADTAGTALCSPLVLTIPDDANSVEVSDHHAALTALVESGAVADLMNCVRSPDTGSDAAGSAIFAGLSEARAAAAQRPTQVVLISDGCEVSSLARLCQEPAPDDLVDRLRNTDLLPDLSDASFRLVGLGRGARQLDGEALASLRAFWSTYAEAAGASTVRFTTTEETER